MATVLSRWQATTQHSFQIIWVKLENFRTGSSSSSAGTYNMKPTADVDPAERGIDHS